MPDPNESLRKASEALDKALEAKRRAKLEEERNFIIASVGKDLAEILKPLLQEIADGTRMTRDDMIEVMKEAISGIKVEAPSVKVPKAEVDVRIPEIKVPKPEITVNVPEIKIPAIKVPKPEVTVKIPDIKIPKIELPEINIPPVNAKALMEALAESITYEHPMPVILTDRLGNPYEAIFGGSGGGKASDVIQGITSGGVKVPVLVSSTGVLQTSGFSGSVQVQSVNPDGVYPGIGGGSSAAGTQYNDEATPDQAGGTGTLEMIFDGSSMQSRSGSSFGVATVQLGGFDGSLIGITSAALDVNIKSGSSSGTQYNDGATPDQAGGTGTLEMIFDGGSTQSRLGSSYGVANVQVSGFDGSLATVTSGKLDVNATQITSPWVVSATDLDIRDLTNATDLVSVYQVSGHQWSTSASQAGTWNIGTVTTVTGVTNSLQAALIDSSGVQYSGSNPVPITGSVTVSGSITSTVAVGPTAADVADDGNAPIQVGGIARQANPTAVAANDVVKATYDDLGRQVMRVLQVRDLINTAYATLNSNSETTLLAGVASTFLDPIYFMGVNTSSNAVFVDIYCGAAGSAVTTIGIPAGGTSGVAVPVPMPQSEVAQAWYVKYNTNTGSDLSNTTALISALFSREV